MKKTILLLAAALSIAAVAALSQETTQARPKPSAGRVASTAPVDDTATHPAPPRELTTGTMHVPPPSATSTQEDARPEAATTPAPIATATTEAPQTTRLQPTQPAKPVTQTDDATSAASAMMLPVGTTVRMKLETALSTITNKAGDTFAGRVTEAVTLDGQTIVPVGASVEGKVLRVDDPRRIKGVPSIDMRPETITMPDGQRYALAASIVDTSDTRHLDVNDEGRIKGHGHDGTDTRNLAIGASAGAGVGLLITHTPMGAAVGGAVGATAATVKWLMTRHEAMLPAGTEIFMELSRPLSLNAAGTAGGR